MDENPDHWWTDCHIHTVVSDFQPDADQVIACLRELGVSKVAGLTVHPQADFWDSEEEPAEPLATWETADLDGVHAACMTAGGVYVTCMMDPVDCGFADLCTDFTEGTRKDWEACVVSLGVGPCSIPDLDHEATEARFGFSLSIGGPGYPRNAERLLRQFPKLPLLTAACTRLSDLIGQRCVPHLCLSYTGGLDDAADETN